MYLQVKLTGPWPRGLWRRRNPTDRNGASIEVGDGMDSQLSEDSNTTVEINEVGHHYLTIVMTSRSWLIASISSDHILSHHCAVCAYDTTLIASTLIFFDLFQSSGLNALRKGSSEGIIKIILSGMTYSQLISPGYPRDLVWGYSFSIRVNFAKCWFDDKQTLPVKKSKCY